MNCILGYAATIAVAILCAATAFAAPTAGAGTLVNVAGASGIAVGGYDPVAFFTDGRRETGARGSRRDVDV